MIDAIGTQKSNVTVSSRFASAVAAYAATTTMASSSSASSAFRLDLAANRTRGSSPVGAGVDADPGGAVT
ncbi:hypothetical protein GCM10022225_41170 [Plantactinospora mayteni]|uniref:Uncharacterized protein n=1 Tax=Plantactinospora mayteni TaxID=566021 RepID=A0ABQ4EU11_9ACTN|nr:hypothetical protein Pma05_47140 [Plantactinospora mayteni]